MRRAIREVALVTGLAFLVGVGMSLRGADAAAFADPGNLAIGAVVRGGMLAFTVLVQQVIARGWLPESVVRTLWPPPPAESLRTVEHEAR